MEKQESHYNMIDWWKKCVLKNYANFSGRARRAEYWYFALFNFILVTPFYVLAMIGTASQNDTLTIFGFALYIILFLGTVIPGLAAAVRRLHDTDKSGWNYLIVLIPLVGPIILLVYLFTNGNRFVNSYGQDPKNETALDFDFDKPQSQTL